MTRIWSAVCLVVACCCGAASAAGGPGTVILVRHAEKAALPSDNPPLSAAGLDRAAALAHALADARIDAIFATQYRRTQDTARKVVAARMIAPIIVKTGPTVEEHARAVAGAVQARAAGEVVLVVGHSNTVPAIIAALGGPKMPDLCDGEYANLFVLVTSADGVRLIRGHYGAPDPPSAADCNRTTGRHH